MLRTIVRTLAFSSLNPSALQGCSISLRFLLTAINDQTIESAYAVQPGPPGSRPTRPGQPCGTLRPWSRSQARPNSLSSRYGMDVQPLHTNGTERLAAGAESGTLGQRDVYEESS
jgi:hypothetical protein